MARHRAIVRSASRPAARSTRTAAIGRLARLVGGDRRPRGTGRGRGRGGRRAARARGPASRAASLGSAWSWPSTCSMPCTTSRASSSSRCRRGSGALRVGHGRAHHDVAEQQGQVVQVVVEAVGAGAAVVGPAPGSRRRRRSGTASTSVGPAWPMKRSFSSAMVASSTNSSDSSHSPCTPSAREHVRRRAPASDRCRPGGRPARRRRRPSTSPSGGPCRRGRRLLGGLGHPRAPRRGDGDALTGAAPAALRSAAAS